MKPEPMRDVPATAGATVEYRVEFSTGPKGKKRMAAGETVAPIAKAVPTPQVATSPRHAAPVAAPPQSVAIPVSKVPSPVAQVTPTPRIPKITLLLVLGHHFERLVREGVVRDYAEIARRTGLTRARVTQIVNLTLLSPEIQEQILTPLDGEPPPTERSLRKLTASASWFLQRRLWRALEGRS